jgi:L-alanine-DL-glutamate epimerase-like enolase superfamily enzyme
LEGYHLYLRHVSEMKSMLIVRARLYPLEVPMSQPIKMAGETLTHAQSLLLCLTDAQGRQGWGEASSAPLMTGETLSSIAASTEYLASKMLGLEIARPEAIGPLMEKILYANASAKSCIETALMDLFAQGDGLPLFQLLAGNTRPAAPARLEMLHMLASGDLDGEIEEARRLRSQGYRQWKIKVGAGVLATDVKRVKAICTELQGDVVSADANQSLSVEQAQAIAQAGVSSGMAFLEQPYRVGMMEAMSRLYADTGMALCADESIQDIGDIESHHMSRATQGVSLKLIKLGGTQALLAAGRYCLSQGLRINLACKVAETTISAAATAHAGFALGEVAWGFSMSNRYLAQDVCAAPLKPVQGAITSDMMMRPGLGFAPETDRLVEFASSMLSARELRA